MKRQETYYLKHIYLYLLMAKHIDTGMEGERLGEAYLIKEGYVIQEKNWRFQRSEVDVIAQKNNTLHFIEIKTRRTKNFGLPEDQVGKKKMENLINAAEQYLFIHPEWMRIQFDILSISITSKQSIEYFLIEDVYL